MVRHRPWYLRWWGIGILVYLFATAVLGAALLAADRRAPARPPGIAVPRAGSFTESSIASVQESQVPVALYSNEDPSSGPANATLTIVEFSDFQCPFCLQAFPIIRAVAGQYQDRVRVVYRDFPVEEIHADARHAAEAAQCALAQGKFWEYHDKLFLNADDLGRDALRRYAREVGLDRAAFESCIDTGATAASVQADLDAGRALGVRGTPTWFFVLDGNMDQARRVEGVITREAFFDLLARLFAS